MAKTTIHILSNAHLSAESRSWLMQSANANFAAAYHGFGTGARIGNIGATLFGFFARIGNDADMPESFAPVVEFAAAEGVEYVLFDADGEIVDTLPSYDENGDLQPGDIDEDPQASFRKTAEVEGWGMFESNGDEVEQIHLCRDDEAEKFPTDADVWLHVWLKSRAGSEPHKNALTFLQENSPAEYEDLVAFCSGSDPEPVQPAGTPEIWEVNRTE